MLIRLQLQNYRGFDNHRIELRPLSIIVGRNNAGKSTVVEALRLISIVTQRLAGLNFRDPPNWAELPKHAIGVSPSLVGLGIDFEAVCHRYGDPPATVHAYFHAGEEIEFRVRPDGVGFAVIRNASGQIIRTRAQLLQQSYPQLSILPQVGPLEVEETILSEDYVRRNLSSPLAPRHFRNQLRLLKGEYLAFRRLAQDTWPGLQIRTLEGARGRQGDPLYLDIRDRDFVAEVSMMGHGLQMWLQTMWFLARAPSDSTVILDEPDVYMHPDLQRRMIRLVKNRFPQVIVATHSVEIMAEVHPSEILIIERSRKESDFADSQPAVQALIERIGGIHNIHLARLWGARRCLFVEGEDIKNLRMVHEILYPDSDIPLDNIPNTSIGGWSGWNYAVGSSLFIRNAFGQNIFVYCILDPDFRTPAQISARCDDAKSKNVNLHIWSQKELENLFLIPSVIVRVINDRLSSDKDASSSEDEIWDRLEEIADSLRNETQDIYADSFFAEDRSRGIQKANKKARALVRQGFESREGKLALVSGKLVLSKLSQWSKDNYGVSFGLRTILQNLRLEEVPNEVKTVLGAIEKNRRL